MSFTSFSSAKQKAWQVEVVRHLSLWLLQGHLSQITMTVSLQGVQRRTVNHMLCSLALSSTVTEGLKKAMRLNYGQHHDEFDKD